MTTRATEWLLASQIGVVGVALTIPHAAPDDFGWLWAVAPPLRWTLAAILIMVLRMAALTINGRWRRSPLLRATGAVLGIMWWLALALIVTAGSKGALSPKALVFVTFAGWEFHACWRCGMDAHRYRAGRAKDGH